MSSIFLSYSSKDNAIAAQVKARLGQWGHQSVFLGFDPEVGIPAGRDWEKELYAKLRECRAVIVLCSHASMASRWCFAEVTHAKALGKLVFPIKIDDVQVDSVLLEFQVINATAGWEKAYDHLEQLLLAARLDPNESFDSERVDVFISYASEDKSRVQALAYALEQQGWLVWWERQVSVGKSFDEVIRAALTAARLVVVVWTKTSVKSTWVKNEAREGLRRGVLYPVILDEQVKIPLEFGEVRAAQLKNWQPAQAHSGFDQLVQDITGVLGRSSSSAIHGSSSRPLQKRFSAQRKVTFEDRGRLVGVSQALVWPIWLGRGLRVVAFTAVIALFLFGSWVVVRWGLTALNASAEAQRVSVVCQTFAGMGPEMIIVPAGSFQMGAASDKGLPTELPRHSVTIRTIAMSTCEVTFDEYDRFAHATGRSLPDDGGWGRGRRPVVNVSWDDAKAYAIWLSEGTGKGYRLPTEAEWEYAARSGGNDETWAGTSEEGQLKEYAVYRVDRTEPVGGKKPNGLGLYDMSGNVQEWVEDCWHGDYTGAPADGSVWQEANGGVCSMRGVRGGSWYNKPENLRASNRDGDGANHRRYTFGFRLAQDLER